MAQTDEQLNSLLSNQQTMEQLVSLAQSLGNLGGASVLGAQNGSTQSATETQNTAQTTGSAIDSETLFNAILASENVDPVLRELVAELRGVETEPDEITTLLLAISPFLCEERQVKLDQIIQLLKLSRIAQLMVTLLRGGDNCV